ncbi:MAG: branched-chain amino acid ABC transporter permease [Acidobacteriota bacterium]
MLQQIANGLTVGAVYALIALGYTMVYGIIELINFAHGDVYMIGAFAGIVVLSACLAAAPALPLPLLLILSFLGAMLVCAAIGYTMERLAYRRLRHAPRLAPLITAIGMSIILQNVVLLAQGARNKIYPPDVSLAVSRHKLEWPQKDPVVTVSYLQMGILAVSIALMVLLHLFITRTRMGKAMRATAQDKKMAALLGINVDRVIATTFIVGSALAAIAGAMVAMYYGSVHYTDGFKAGLKAFTAAVLGGIGNIPGAMLGGVVLGLLETFGAAQFGGEWKDFVAFTVLILVLIVKPSGLLGQTVADKV